MVTSDMMEDRNGVCHVMEESEVDVQTRQTQPQTSSSSSKRNWSNGQCVVSIPSFSSLNPSFDLTLCRAKLERDGFQIPVTDLEAPLKSALDVPSVRRYMVFNSALFRFIMAPVLYVVVWCAVFSTLHLYIPVSDYWVLCLSVSLASILLTTAVVFVLHRSNHEINVNLDVRLVQVNERMVKHELLVGVADWVHNCTGNMQLYFLYWDVSRCLRTLTETLEDQSFMTSDAQQSKLKSRMSGLVLVADVPAEGSEEEDERRPLLDNEDGGCRAASGQRGGNRVTSTFSLVPDAALPAQAKAFQLLMTFSSVYVKLLVSERLSGPSGPSDHGPHRNHCSSASLCLCQFIRNKILQ